MLYEYDLVVPAHTPATAPVNTEMVLTQGIIHRLEVTFPAGCGNEVHVVIRRAVHQVWPTNPGGTMKGNFWTISVPVWYEMEEAPYRLHAYGWSPGANFPHTITIRLGLERRELLMPPREELAILRRLGGLIFGPRR